MVLALHLDQIHGNWLGPRLPFVAQGYLGVDIFFVLSGFILAHVYGLAPLRSARDYGVFLWRRFARIYPLHLATLLALVAMVAARGLLGTNFWDVSDLPRHLLLMQAWTSELTWNLPAWSISAEWAAYVAFPLLAAAMLKPARMLLPAALVVLLLAGFQVFGINRAGLSGSWLGWPALWRIACEFTLGILVYRASLSVAHSWRSDAVAVMALVMVFAVPVPILKVALIGLFVGAVATSGGPVRRLFASRIAVALGIASYSLYMVHFPAIKLIQNVNDRLGIEQASPAFAMAMLTAWACVIVAIAALAYRLIERPARNWCRRREAKVFGPGRAPDAR